MKRVAFDELLNKHKKQKDIKETKWYNIEKWLDLVISLKYDSMDHLIKLLHIPEPKENIELSKYGYRKDNNVHVHSKVTNKIYLYTFEQSLYYGDGTEYPVSDKTLWPWITLNYQIPDLSVDIGISLSRFLRVKDIVKCTRVSKGWNRIFSSDVVWKPIFDSLFPSSINIDDIKLSNSNYVQRIPYLSVKRRARTKTRIKWLLSQSQRYIISFVIGCCVECFQDRDQIVSTIESFETAFDDTGDTFKIVFFDENHKRRWIFSTPMPKDIGNLFHMCEHGFNQQPTKYYFELFNSRVKNFVLNVG